MIDIYKEMILSMINNFVIDIVVGSNNFRVLKRERVEISAYEYF